MLRQLIHSAYYSGRTRRAILEDVGRAESLFMSSRDEIDTYVGQQLAAILEHARQTVPYYRDYLSCDEITSINALEVLSTLPILTKAIVRSEGTRLHSEKPGRSPFYNTSGGSTGEPVRLLQDKDMNRRARTFEFLFMKWAGHQIGSPHILMWGVPEEELGLGVSLHERIFRFANNETYLNCYRIDEEVMEGWVKEINRRKPDLIEAYVDALIMFCKFVNKYSLDVWSPNGIITSAGVLSPNRRNVLNETFGCTVINRYGSREVNNVACSCPENTELHINEAICYIEVVDENGRRCLPGIEGDILVTLFINRTMPLIRYKIEDRGVLSDSTQCACGRMTARLVRVSGRSNDFLLTSAGQRINGTALTTLLYGVEEIRQFQYQQKSVDAVRLLVVPIEGSTETTLKAALERPIEQLQAMLDKTRLELEVCSEIPPSKSGKFRYVINDSISKII